MARIKPNWEFDDAVKSARKTIKARFTLESRPPSAPPLKN